MQHVDFSMVTKSFRMYRNTSMTVCVCIYTCLFYMKIDNKGEFVVKNQNRKRFLDDRREYKEHRFPVSNSLVAYYSRLFQEFA